MPVDERKVSSRTGSAQLGTCSSFEQQFEQKSVDHGFSGSFGSGVRNDGCDDDDVDAVDEGSRTVVGNGLTPPYNLSPGSNWRSGSVCSRGIFHSPITCFRTRRQIIRGC